MVSGRFSFGIRHWVSQNAACVDAIQTRHFRRNYSLSQKMMTSDVNVICEIVSLKTPLRKTYWLSPRYFVVFLNFSLPPFSSNWTNFSRDDSRKLKLSAESDMPPQHFRRNSSWMTYGSAWNALSQTCQLDISDGILHWVRKWWLAT